jgi:MSHA biogenesis protein MshI
MKQINLYQAEFRPTKVVMPARLLLSSVALFLLILFALYGWGHWQLKNLQVEVVQAEQNANAATSQLAASLGKMHKIDPNLATETQSLEARVRTLQLAQDAISKGELGSDTGYSVYFRALANIVHSGAWLTKVTISDRGRAMDLQGRVLTGADSARLIANLRNAPLFVGLSFSGLVVGSPNSAVSTPAASTLAARASDLAQADARFLTFSLKARLPEASAEQAAQLPEQLPEQLPGGRP